MKRAVVLGAGGFIGGHLVVRLKSMGYFVRGVDLKEHELTNKEFLLINTLSEKGNWQIELVKSGFNYTLINSMVGKDYLVKSKRKKTINQKPNLF